mgnify:CR=1 FL=1
MVQWLFFGRVGGLSFLYECQRGFNYQQKCSLVNVKLKWVKDRALDAAVSGDEAATYTYAGGKEATISQFVNTFGIYKRGNYDGNTMVMTQEDVDASALKSGVSGFAWSWAPVLSKTVLTASFLGDTSDAFPMTEFTIGLVLFLFLPYSAMCKG